MRILAVDTATPTCSVAIHDAAGVVCELTLGQGRTHSTQLLGLIQSALSAARLAAAEIEGFGVTIGPGSFTGLRIGLGVIKGLAFALGRPAVGISSLEALAHPWRGWPGVICPLLDARKGEVYFNHFVSNTDGYRAPGADAVGPVEAALADGPDPCLFVGDGARLYRERIIAALGERARFAGSGFDPIRGSSVAELARARLLRDPRSDAALLVPRYVRRPDAKPPLPPDDVARPRPAPGAGGPAGVPTDD